ncbi:YwqH-like family protein [Fictibacillus gelatini]|uniref:YwqH-like family protein n=1 Tax=Fictibacillus gelatini TaxID=225985 RepID=UPI0003F98A88|nr:DUF5082 family protein [Fictibacillus gelatini]
MDVIESTIRSNIASSNALIRVKQEQIHQLLACKKKLADCRSDFHDNKSLCLNPSLSNRTYHGSWASQFDEIRKQGIQSAYHDVTKKQFQHAFKVLTDKITQLQSEIDALQLSVTALETQLAILP